MSYTVPVTPGYIFILRYSNTLFGVQEDHHGLEPDITKTELTVAFVFNGHPNPLNTDTCQLPEGLSEELTATFPGCGAKIDDDLGRPILVVAATEEGSIPQFVNFLLNRGCKVCLTSLAHPTFTPGGPPYSVATAALKIVEHMRYVLTGIITLFPRQACSERLQEWMKPCIDLIYGKVADTDLSYTNYLSDILRMATDHYSSIGEKVLQMFTMPHLWPTLETVRIACAFRALVVTKTPLPSEEEMLQILQTAVLFPEASLEVRKKLEAIMPFNPLVHYPPFVRPADLVINTSSSGGGGGGGEVQETETTGSEKVRR